MANDGPERLLREYRHYDSRCDIVSCFEVFFTEARQMADTVAHFERFPRLGGADGNPATPDFTVRFTDATMLVGEISNLARVDESVDRLLRQIERYTALTEGPARSRASGGHELAAVSAADVLLLVPTGEANAARDRIAAALDAATDPPAWRPCVLGYSYDDPSSRYVFTYDDRSANPRPPSHGRSPSLETWLLANHDTLICPSERFSRVTAVKRFMNDRPPPLYTATLLWMDVLPALATEPPPVDVAVSAAEIADWLREHYGWGDANAVTAALEFLHRAGLARERQSDWVVAWRVIATAREEVHRELVDRYLARPRGPVTSKDRLDATSRQARDRDAETEARERQQPLDFG